MPRIERGHSILYYDERFKQGRGFPTLADLLECRSREGNKKQEEEEGLAAYTAR
jgi:hypothetical protein